MKGRSDAVNILYLHRLGFSERMIANRLGISRPTVHKYLEHPELIGQYILTKSRQSKLDPYKNHISEWLKEDPHYRATWIYDRLRVLGFEGSYDLVKRHVRGLKDSQARVAYMRFETEPGNQAQVDFAEFQVVQPDGSVRKYYLFALILGYSRKLYAELIERCDMPSFLDCHIRAFTYLGGVPREILYDRMKNVFIRRIAGNNEFNRTMIGFALHYNFKPLVTPAYAPWVKGKIERPYSFIREGFWRGYSFTHLDRANNDLLEWLIMKEERIHGTTHEKISDRFDRERVVLYPPPPIAFDTSYRVFRKVHKDCTVQFEGNRYVVSHRLVGEKVLVRHKNEMIRIFVDNELHVTYALAHGNGNLVLDPKFYRELQKDRDMNRRKYGRTCFVKGRAKATISPLKQRYEMDVQVRPVSFYEQAINQELSL